MKRKIISLLAVIVLLSQGCQNDDPTRETLPPIEKIEISSKGRFDNPIQYDNASDAFTALRQSYNSLKTETRNINRKFAGIVITNNSNTDLNLKDRIRSGVLVSPFDKEDGFEVSVARGKSIGLLAAEIKDAQDINGVWSYQIEDTDKYYNIAADLSDVANIKLKAEISQESLLTEPSTVATTGEFIHSNEGANAIVNITDEINYNTVQFTIDKNFLTTTSQSVKDIVSYLASDELKGRFIATQGYEKAGKYVENAFKKYGVAPFFESYRDEFSAERNVRFDIYNWGTETFNVVGYLEGTDPTLANEYVVIGAHLDTAYTYPNDFKDGDEVINGANDNGTGVSAVLSLAKYLAGSKNNKRSVIFALFGAEEVGIQGSKHLAKKLKEQGLNLYAMLNFEMIGVPLIDQTFSAYITGYNTSNLGAKINEYSGMSNLVGLHPRAQQFDLFQRSDNYSFYTEFNVPSQTVSSFIFDNYAHYHKVGDETSEQDFDFIAKLINDLTPAVVKILNTPTKEIILSAN